MKMKTGYGMRCAYILMHMYVLDRITTIHMTGNNTYKGEKGYEVG